MLSTGVSAVGEERGESSWGNLRKLEKAPSRKWSLSV